MRGTESVNWTGRKLPSYWHSRAPSCVHRHNWERGTRTSIPPAAAAGSVYHKNRIVPPFTHKNTTFMFFNSLDGQLSKASTEKLFFYFKCFAFLFVVWSIKKEGKDFLRSFHAENRKEIKRFAGVKGARAPMSAIQQQGRYSRHRWYRLSVHQRLNRKRKKCQTGIIYPTRTGDRRKSWTCKRKSNRISSKWIDSPVHVTLFLFFYLQLETDIITFVVASSLKGRKLSPTQDPLWPRPSLSMFLGSLKRKKCWIKSDNIYFILGRLPSNLVKSSSLNTRQEQ